MAQALFSVAVHDDVADALAYLSFEPVAQRTIMLRTLGQLFTREFGRFSKRDDSGNVLGPGAAFAPLVPAAVLSVQSHAATNVKRADAFWRIQLVCGHRQQVTAEFVDV